jgi:ACT domain-containing protein
MKGIITVLGKDAVGIIAKVSAFTAENNINILDLSQTIVQGFFSMLMIVDLTGSKLEFRETAEGLNKIGEQIGMQIKLQHEDIFNVMHRI